MTSVEALMRELGVRVGRSMAERLAAEHPDATPPAEPAPAKKAAARTPALLPGLSGRRRRPGEPPPPCGRPGCGKPSRTRGYCQTHYVQWLKSGR